MLAKHHVLVAAQHEVAVNLRHRHGVVDARVRQHNDKLGAVAAQLLGGALAGLHGVGEDERRHQRNGAGPLFFGQADEANLVAAALDNGRQPAAGQRLFGRKTVQVGEHPARRRRLDPLGQHTFATATNRRQWCAQRRSCTQIKVVIAGRADIDLEQVENVNHVAPFGDGTQGTGTKGI